MSTMALIALLGSPITYAAWHRTHHAYSDTDKDPHSPTHNSWLYVVFAHYQEPQLKRSIDRMRDPYFAFLTKHMIYYVVIGNLFLFLALPFDWFLTLWAIPVACMVFSTNFIVLVLSHRTGIAKNLTPLFWPLVYDDGIHHANHHFDDLKLSHTKYDPAGYIVRKLGWVNEKI
jgi:stearoyl-CoA desaturase (delta-9 desaturase)